MQTLKYNRSFGEELYAVYKKQCDEYFVNQHATKKTRAIGYFFMIPAGRSEVALEKLLLSSSQ